MTGPAPARSTRLTTWLWLAFFAVVLTPFFAEVYRGIRADALRKSGVATTAEVLELREAEGVAFRLRAGAAIDVRVRYTVAGTLVTGSFVERSSDLAVRPLRPGESVNVVYDPAQPARVVRATH
jgi:hypothetical protein